MLNAHYNATGIDEMERAFGIGFEDHQDLLGHKSGQITTHYSAPELENLIEAANSVCRVNSRKSPAIVVLK